MALTQSSFQDDDDDDDDDDDRFYTAIFSALEQTHCAFVAYDSKCVIVAFSSAFSISTEMVYLQRTLVITSIVHRFPFLCPPPPGDVGGDVIWILCPRVMSQAPQQFRSARVEATLMKRLRDGAKRIRAFRSA